MSESKIADLFSLQQLGPFPLVHRPDVTLVKEKSAKTWSAAELTGNLASTLPLSGDGLDFWLGACEVDWAYQAAEGGSGSFEEFGGFYFNDAVYEIGSSDSAEMTLHFSWPFEMTEEDWNKCSNPASVTIQSMLDAGAQEYCWEVDHDYCDKGCFIYKTDKGYQGFAVKSFALGSIGPFHLNDVSDLPVTITGDTWTAEGSHSGSVSTGTKGLGSIGRNFWFDASEVTWAYQGESAETASQSFYQYGGYVLRDAEGLPTMMLEIGAKDDNTVLTVEFGNPFEISSVEWSACQNPAPVTIASMIELGAKQYCWEQHWDRCPRGCFLYKTTDGYQAFAVEDFAMSSLGPFRLTDAGVSDTDTTALAASNTWQSPSLAFSGKMSTAASGTFWTNAGYQDVRWLYPPADPQGSTGSFAVTGGFVVTSQTEGEDPQTAVLEIMKTEGAATLTQGFTDPMHITQAEFTEGCSPGPADITLVPLLTIGTEQYCWVAPGTTAHCESGCFFYKTRTGHQAFAVHSA